jgi:hypothetical protein
MSGGEAEKDSVAKQLVSADYNLRPCKYPPDSIQLEQN